MDSARSTRQLGFIAEVLRVADELDVQIWLRDGWAMDFFLGEITRDHVDIDWFAWAYDAQVLVKALVSRGYREVPGPPGRLGDLTCPIVSAAAQIEIKEMMPVWVPGMRRRPKDAEDIARLRAALG